MIALSVVSEHDAKQADAIKQLEDGSSSGLGKYGLEKAVSLCLLRSCQQRACIELLESLLCSEQTEKQNALDETAALKLELGELNKIIEPHLGGYRQKHAARALGLLQCVDQLPSLPNLQNLNDQNVKNDSNARSRNCEAERREFAV